MATVLMGWELGEGLGHVQPLLRIAKALAAKGHRPVFAVKDLIAASAVLAQEPFPVVQAPLWPRRAPKQPFQAATFADILALRGYADAVQLGAMVRAWQDLIDLVRPELIICDHSPTLCLTALGAVPVMMIGTGFTVPPASGDTFPILRSDAKPTMPQERLLGIIQEVQRKRGRPEPVTLPGIFREATAFVCTYAELDPYQKSRQTPHLGPLNPLLPLAEPPRQPSLFVYLSSDFAGLDKLLPAIARMRMPTSLYLRGAPRQLVENVRKLGIQCFETPAPLPEVLPKVSAILHHGGLLTTEDALSAGRPQILLPRYLEQELTARIVKERGVGLYLASKTVAQQIGPTLHQVIADPRFSNQAMTWARSIHARGPSNPVDHIMGHCRLRLGDANARPQAAEH